ncbi:MAG: HlyC/CorC family transporter [Gammaproteobacteria bacterium]|nr:HlyC/CorC family transporter [Gammaproteobacteria bacterium]
MNAWIVYGIVIVFLVLFSAFFSAAETGLMAVNRYRIRHKARQKKRSAILILRLLKRPDRLLGTILIGNSVANILASALATVLAVHLFGDEGVVVSTIVLTIFILVVAEVAPKTVAALYPERVATLAAWPVSILLKVFYPLVWFVNTLSNGLLRLFRIKVTDSVPDALSREELRSVVHDASKRISREYQDMLLGILDLNKVTVNDIMVPRHKIVGIDLVEDWETICQTINNSTHDYLPVFHENINQLVGMLHLRELMRELLSGNTLTREALMRKIQEAYFVPENTPLNIQLLNFQREQQRTALIVDEYGDILGLLSMSDILEQIVGAFATDISGTTRLIQKQADGSYLVDGTLSVREFNRLSGWELPVRGPRTLSGLIIEYLEAIPRAGTCVRIKNYPIEVVHMQDNRVKVARLFPSLVI